MSTLHKNTTSERGVFFPQVTQDDTLSVSLGAIRKTDTSNRDASLLKVLFKDPAVEGLLISESLH